VAQIEKGCRRQSDGCACAGSQLRNQNQTNGKPSGGLLRAVEKNTGLAAQQDVQFDVNRKRE
jgi:hypothetical protein